MYVLYMYVCISHILIFGNRGSGDLIIMPIILFSDYASILLD